MRILLINSPLYRNTVARIGPIVESLFYNSAPLGLCYLAAVLEQAGHEVQVIDAPVERLDGAGVIRKAAVFRPDVVGISTYTTSIYASYRLAEEIRQAFPAAKVVLGGDHITSHPQELLRLPQIDAAVIGEGEVTFLELIAAWQSGSSIEGVKGLAYRQEGRLLLSAPREYVPDLDVLPFPARHLVPIRRYRPQPNDMKRLPKLSMISSRGCPYGCIFCDKSVFKNIYRSFSPAYIVSEMRHLVKDFGARDIAFVDSTFTPNKKRVSEIVEEIKKANLDVTWTCSVRADVLDREILSRMKDAGCWRIRLGIESGNEEVMAFIKKGTTKFQVRQVAEWAYELRLAPKGFFMIGHLVDTPQTIEESIRFACSLPLRDITVQINTPLKNTPQYGLIEKYGQLTTQDVSRYSFWEPIFIPHGMGEDELYYYYAKFYLSFYLRPRVWFGYLSEIRSLADLVKYARGAKILFFFFLSWLRKRC